MAKTGLVRDGQVVSMDYMLIVDGTMIDASEKGKPLQFIQGRGMIIPGLERALYGLGVGAMREVSVAPRDGYGETNPQAILEFERSRFPADMLLEEGGSVQMRHENGKIVAAKILEIGPERVKLDFNHPLAGKQLNFAIKIVAIRKASAEELEHGRMP